MIKETRILSASENNLKGIDICIPHGKLTVVTGISGSGKSSLVRDILFREGQRMYFETFSSHTRTRLGKVRPAKVSEISGLLPVISVGQTHIQSNRRSTAGTFSEISNLLRHLFSRFNDQKQALSRSHFSMNSEKGWCKKCKGLGINEFIDVKKIVADPHKTLRQGALGITLPNGYTIYSQVTIDELNKVCKSHGFDVDTPWNLLSSEQSKIILYGSDRVKILYGKHSLESRMKWTGMTARPRDEGYYRGIIPVMEDILKRDRNENILRFVSSGSCDVCHGSRLNQFSDQITWHGLRYTECESLTFRELLQFLKDFAESSKPEEQLIQELISQLHVLCRLSTGHISCNRLTETLSQGELRRIRLSQLHHSGLTGVMYLFDEPSIGLHARDVKVLIDIMYNLCGQGNTVVIVEHNEQIIRAAEWLIELGPGAGFHGGKLVFQGNPADLKKTRHASCLTAEIIKQPQVAAPLETDSKHLETFQVFLKQAHNIHNETFTFALNAMNVITGVSGAGKSTLVSHGLTMLKSFQNVLHIDQKPIGRTSRSNPATYTGLADELRTLFASSEDARKAKLTSGHFSFNNKAGQCEICQGAGVLKTGMMIFEDMVQTCPVCHGQRFKVEVLGVKYNHKNISQVLELSVGEALDFFCDAPSVLPYLRAMDAFGLNYLTLGQSSSTLSGGEAQRVKLARNLHSEKKGNTLYILDEPTSGLHSEDIRKLMSALHEFIEKGHTVVIVEHDPQVVMSAAWIVDIGPEGGKEGGKCLFAGRTSDFFRSHQSPTTQALKTPFSMSPPVRSIRAANINLKDITTNTLKHIDLEISPGTITAFTGVSGSGKTSLLLHTIHAEGQRLFTAGLSGYQRLQIGQLRGGQIGKINSIMPTVAVESEIPAPHLRTTTAAMAGIFSLIRLLYARFADNRTDSLTSSDFSYVNEFSVCPSCEGIGFIKQCDPGLLITDHERALQEGAAGAHKTIQYFLSENNKHVWILRAMAAYQGIDLNIPWNHLEPEHQKMILNGTGPTKYKVLWNYQRKNNTGEHQFEEIWSGLITLIEEEYRIHYPSARGKQAAELLKDTPCEDCQGYRLNKKMLRYTFAGRHIGQMTELSIEGLLQELNREEYSSVSEALIRQLKDKLGFLNQAGIGYLPLNRPAAWLSSGELKWIRLSSVMASQLSGMCIILDEPSYGLDKKSRQHLASSLLSLKEKGNTILISDHHPEMIRISDRIIELGPGSGNKGGHIVADLETHDIILQKNNTATVASFILHNKKTGHPEKSERDETTPIIISDAIKIFPGKLNLITGPTGSGKTRMLMSIYRQLIIRDSFNVIMAGNSTSVFQKGISIASKSGYLNDLQKVFSDATGLPHKDFSYHTAGSQCPACKGNGQIITELDFLPDVTEECQDCEGRRYTDAILNHSFQGKNISQWLQMTVDEVSVLDWISQKTLTFFNLLTELGLGYLNCSRDIQTMSTGEKQRLAIASQLNTGKHNQTILLFDSPARGLDPFSIQKMAGFLQWLTQKGNTVIVAETDQFSEIAGHLISVSSA